MLRVVPAICLILALLCSADSPTPVLLPSGTDWGAPPGNDWPQPDVTPPDFKGWMYYMRPGGFGHVVASSSRHVLIGEEKELCLIDAAEAEVSWKKEVADSWTWSGLSNDEVMYTRNGPAVDAVDLNTGEKIWTSPEGNWSPLAIAPSGLWVTRDEIQPDASYQTWSQDVALLDAKTGIPQQLFALGALTSFEPMDRLEIEGGTVVYLPVKTRDGLFLLSPDGGSLSIKSIRQEWSARFAVSDTGFAAFEFAPYPDIPEGLSDEESEAFAHKKLIDPTTDLPGAAAYLSWYDFPEGKLRWQIPVSNHWQIMTSAPEVSNGYILLKLENLDDQTQVNKFEVFDVRDGSIVYTYDENTPGSYEGSGEFTLANGRLYRLQSEPDSQKLSVLDLATQRTANMDFNFKGMYCGAPLVRDGYIQLQLESGGWNEAFPSNSLLVRMPLDETGLPKAGRMKVINPPDSFAELLKRLLASPEPVKDAVLMREVVGGGYNAVLRSLEHLDASNGPQLDALAAATVYISNKRDAEGQRYNLNYIDTFVSMLRDRELTPYAPVFERWAADSSLAPLHNMLGGLRAMAGRPSDILAGFWSQLGPHRFAEAARLTPHSSHPTGFGPGTISTQVSTLSSGGANYAAFYSDGLTTGALVYFALDHDGDGRYEEVLPSSLLHYFLPGIERGTEDRKDKSHFVLKSVDGDKVTLEYVRVTGPEDNDQSYWDLPSEVTTAVIDLTELRRDTDGDGLTDLTEAQLYTDIQTPDTDGDGLSDRDDPAPNVDQSKMGVKERAIARALKYYFDWPEGHGNKWWTGGWTGPTGNPWMAKYIYVRGAQPVAFTPDAKAYCISLALPDDKYWPDFPAGHISGDESLTVALQIAGVDNADTDFGVEILPHGKGADAAVTISFGGVGYAVDMTEIDGEYYPTRVRMTWIS